MSIPIDGVRILANLVAVGQQFGGPSGPQADFGSGEYLAGSVTSMSADGLAPAARLGARFLLSGLSETRLADFVTKEFFATGKLSLKANENPVGAVDAYGAGLILWTLTVIDLLELTTGFGPPYEGDELKEGSRRFVALSAQLGLALPDGSWQGAAAQVYAEADTTLGRVAQRMAELDLQLAALIHNQADWVTHIRLGLGILKGLLVAAYIVHLGLVLSPGVGLAWAKAFAYLVCALGISAGVGMLLALGYYSYDNAQHADAVAAQYRRLTRDPVSGGAVVQAKVATAAREPTVSSFESVSADMATTSATGEPSPLASVAGVADGSADQRAGVSGLRGAGEAAAVGAATVAPTVSMPTLAQVSAWSGQAATLSGHASQHVNLVNQTMGSVQQITSLGQQTQPAPAPAAGETPTEDGAALEAAPKDTAGEMDGAAAGVGTDAVVQRAPLEAVALNIHEGPSPTRSDT
ncbi:hypothetical protein A5641_04035 [Mycobacterium sp. 1554424.7]|nr:hypothetical protein A5641_04035 [Mycobacterium sp. 1554424.7]